MQAEEIPTSFTDPRRGPFVDRFRPSLRSSNVTILDVGAGRRPTIPSEWRPSGTYYVGLDIAGDELAIAEPDAYDEVVVGDIGTHVPALDDRFDLIVSWQVLEHVEVLAASLENAHRYLRPGGRMVAMLSGSYAVFALMARVIPYGIRMKAMTRYLGVEPGTRFETHYNKCTFRALDAVLSSWSGHEVVPLYCGADYFSPWPVLERMYVTYEDWIERSHRVNLATHYLIVGDR